MSKALERLRMSLKQGKKVQLGIGPMSIHCVDAVIEMANAARHPLMLVASRRQIEAASKGGGYVNNWTTKTFAQYVRERDKGGYVVLCRDHGGPWQNSTEIDKNLSIDEAMASAKESFSIDIESGFDVIHLDPSIDIHKKALSQHDVLERLFELWEHCIEVSKELSADVAFEVGTEEQSGINQGIESFEQLLEAVTRFSCEQNIEKPLFVVGQTGTLTKETHNVGTFSKFANRIERISTEIEISKIIEICRQYGIYLKAHNVDYLSNEDLIRFLKLRVHSANIAPELGVLQTCHILQVCKEFGLKRESDKLLELAYNSGKWKKWMLPSTNATDFVRATIAGHYVFSTEEFQEIMSSIRLQCRTKDLDIDSSIRESIKLKIASFMYSFNLFSHLEWTPKYTTKSLVAA